MSYQYESMKVFPKGAINGLTKKLNSMRFGRSAPNAREIYDAMELTQRGSVERDMDYSSYIMHFAHTRRIERAQTTFGKAWLKQWFYKLNGSKRTGKRVEGVSDRVLRLANKITRFEFIGVLEHTNWYGEPQQYTPIYRAYTSTGEYFDYSPIMWSNPIIMEGY